MCWYFEFGSIEPATGDGAVVARTERVSNTRLGMSLMNPVVADPAEHEDVHVDRRTSGTADAMARVCAWRKIR